MPAEAVRIRNLTMQYGSIVAVDELSLSVTRGSITAILGPNGAGKTTTIETCEGFRVPQSGEVRVLGLDPVAERQQLRERIGIMLQAGGAWQAARVDEIVRHAAALYSRPRDPYELLDRLGLAAMGSTKYGRLSGGQRQSVNLVTALVGRPDLVFLDEPTAGLDPHARRATWELLREINAGGTTIVLTTHYLAEAEECADLIHILDAGHVIASGTATELASDHAGEGITFATTDQINEPRWSTRFADHRLARIGPSTWRLTGRVDARVVADLTSFAVDQSVFITSLRTEVASLEEIYLSLTKDAS